MMLIKNKLSRLLILLSMVFVARFNAPAQQMVKPITISKQSKNISLLNQADYALSGKSCKTLADLHQLDWHILDDSVTTKKEFDFSVLQFWVHFSTNSTFERDSTLLLKLDSKMQHSQLFERVGGKLLLIGQTGFGSKTSALSIANDYWRIYLPLKSQKRRIFMC